MANIPGINLADAVVPFTTDDDFATHYAKYGNGGWREVATIAERDAIPTARREAGMAVYVTGVSKLYILNSNLTTWTEFAGGGSGSAEWGSIGGEIEDQEDLNNTFVHKIAGAETIISNTTDGYKTFSDGFQIGNPDTSRRAIFSIDNYGTLRIIANSQTVGLDLGSNAVAPTVTSNTSLGNISHQFKDVYLSGKIVKGSTASPIEITTPSQSGTLALTSDIQTYTEGTGIDITNNEVSVDTTVIQEKLSAGTGISITGNTISTNNITWRNW